MRSAQVLALSSVLVSSAAASPLLFWPFQGSQETSTPCSTTVKSTSTSSSSIKTTTPCSTTTTAKATSTTSSSSFSSSSVVKTSTSSSAVASSTSSSSSSSSVAVISTSSSSSSVVSSTVVATSSSLTSSAPAVTPTLVLSDDGYNYQFCAIEPFENGVPNGRALTGDKFTSSNMTVDDCGDYCSNLGFSLFGVEYSSECYCGNSFNDGTTLDTANTCTQACSGDATELCGGPGAMNVYQIAGAAAIALPTTYTYTATATATGAAGGAGGAGGAVATASSTATATFVASAAGYTAVACAIEPFSLGLSYRMLQDDSTSASNMTVETCAAYCSDYAYFAVEYSAECYCGNTVAVGTTQDISGGCNMACNGDNTEQCGGSARANLYENPANGGSQISLPLTYLVPAATTSSVAVSSTSSVVVASTTSSVVVASSTSSSSSAVKTSSSSTSSNVVATSSAIKTSSSSIPTTLATSTKCSTTSTASAVATAAPGVCAPKASTDLSICPTLTMNTMFGHAKFSNFYKGSGYTMNTANPGNLLAKLFPPKVATFDGSHSICSAASQCMQQAGFAATLYHSFDLHWDTNNCQWSCTLFQGQMSQGSYFNVPQPQVAHSCGFSGGLF